MPLAAVYRWHGYLKWLPSTLPGLPMFWSAKQLALLEGTSVAAKMSHGSGAELAAICAVEPPFAVSNMSSMCRAPGRPCGLRHTQ